MPAPRHAADHKAQCGRICCLRCVPPPHSRPPEMEGGAGLGFWSNVVDPRLSAPRGDGAVNEAIEDSDRPWRAFSEGDAATPSASESRPIDGTNRGFRLLEKMGWVQGRGLGRNEDGIVEPIRGGADAGVRLGLGKQQEDDHYTNAELIGRKKLESEVQALYESDARRERREAAAARDARIKDDVTAMLSTFFCEVCSKQYKSAVELDAHLSSYDHHHAKRLKETKAMVGERGREERLRREERVARKEQARLDGQAQRAREERERAAGVAAAAGSAAAASAPPPPPLPPEASTSGQAPPPPPPPPGASALPEQRAAIAFGMKPGFGGGGGGAARGGMGGAALGHGRGGSSLRGGGAAGRGTQRPPPAAAAKVAASAFGASSSDDEEGGG